MLLHEQLKDYNLILASGSPRRRELLKSADLPFTVAENYHVEEIYPPELKPSEVPAYLSLLKSNAYPVPLSVKDLLITADTVVIAEGHVIGKPVAGEANQTLAILSGKTHAVISAVTLRSVTKTTTFDCTSQVTFRRLESEEMQYYTEKYKPYDKAGAYGIQEWIGCVGIERIDGSFYNVMGLPIQMLYQKLKTFI